MNAYLLGLLTLPAIALAGWLMLLLIQVVRNWWVEWRPTYVGHELHRANHAAGLATARRVLVIDVPGGRVLAWRSTTGTRSDDRAYQAWAMVYDAISEALYSAPRNGGA